MRRLLLRRGDQQAAVGGIRDHRGDGESFHYSQDRQSQNLGQLVIVERGQRERDADRRAKPALSLPKGSANWPLTALSQAMDAPLFHFFTTGR